MAGEWRQSTWGEEISLEYGKALRGYDGVQGQYRVFGTNGPVGWTSQPLASGPGVILGRKGAYRGVHYSPDPFFVIDTAYYVVPKTALDMRWLYYAIKHYELGEVDDGSPIPSTTRSAVYVLDLEVPPLPEQRAIAHILGTLDDKIKLNRRMNETLEAMARALFKSWFVDFDPVRAKTEGRLPAGRQAAPPPPKPGAWFVYALECENGSVYVGHAEDVQRRFDEHARGKGAEWTKRHPPRRIAYWEDLPTRTAAAARERKLKTGSGRKWLKQEIARRDLSNGGLPQPLADLFPDRLEESELGEIPKGWEVLRVGEVLTAMGGGTPSTKEPRFWDGGEYNWATPKDMSNLSAPILLDTERKITEDGLAQISSGLLPVGTVLLSSRAPVGYLALAATPVAVNQGFIAMRCDGPVSNYYALNWCHFRMDEIKQRASGTTFAEISKAAFRPIPMIVPGTGVMQYFTDRVQPLYKAIEEKLREVRTLAALRDTLLPKLISGEIRVKDAERLAGGAI